MSASTLTSNTGYMSGIEPLTGTNFSTWKDQVKLTLGVMDLDHAFRIDPPAALTAESTVDQKRAYEQWERSNRVSLMIIKNSIFVAIQGAIPDSENAKEYLSSVEKQFKGTSKAHLKAMDMEISEEEERLKVEKPDVVHVATTNSNTRKGSRKGKGSRGDNSTPNKDCPKSKEWLAKKCIFESSMINESFNINVPINSWWIDSGSMVHTASSLQGFCTIRRLERNQRTVKVENEVDLNVEAIGTLSLILEAEVENQLDRKIKVVRSDRGGEYYGRHTDVGQALGSFFDFCKDHGIINQYTMSGTPQQNGIVERRNRTLMDMVRSMYPERSKGYRLYCPSHSTGIVKRRHAEFLENANNSGSGSFRRIELQEARDETPIIHLPIPINTPLDSSNDHLIAQDHPKNVEENEPNLETNREAIEDELNSMSKNNVWELAELPKGANPVGCKWVYKTKLGPKGNVERYKARLLAKGYTQMEGIDYKETFSPVSKKDSLRIVMALVAHFDLELHQMDVKTEFLNGYLHEDVYMAQPQGFKSKGQEHLVCKLKKSIYGLKQASRQWYLEFDEVMKKHNFIKNQVASNNIDLLHESKRFLSRNFDMKDLGEASYVIRIEIHQDRANGKLGLSQKAYIERVLNRFNMQHCSPTVAPVIKGDVFGSHQCPKSKVEYEEMKRIHYASVVGSLTYAQVCTRPDIAYICGMLGWFQSNPGLLYWKAAKKVLRYLQGNKEYKLTYTRSDNL
ncbi:putative zinc finger, CCHC-type containing protein [Tanacetum coccineum]